MDFYFLYIRKKESLNMNKKWNEQEENYLIVNFYDMRNEDISKVINRSVDGISKKACSLKLRKNPSYKNKVIYYGRIIEY